MSVQVNMEARKPVANNFLTIDTRKFKAKAALNIQKAADNISKKVVKKAAYALFEHIKEQADEKLNTRKQFYKNNLEIKDWPENGGYRIILRKTAAWIENGLNGRQLRDTMLSKGQTHRVIPLSEVSLSGTNKAKKVAPASAVRFRTMSLNQGPERWQTKLIKGVKIFESSRKWIQEQIKNKAFGKK